MNVVLRPWQNEFMTWLEHENSKRLVNLCGGSWGKTWMAVRLRALHSPQWAVYHAVVDEEGDAVEVDDFLQNTAKIERDWEAGKTVVVVSLVPLYTKMFREDTVVYELGHDEPVASIVQ